MPNTLASVCEPWPRSNICAARGTARLVLPVAAKRHVHGYAVRSAMALSARTCVIPVLVVHGAVRGDDKLFACFACGQRRQLVDCNGRLTFARPIMPIVSWHTKPTTVTVSLPRRRTACHSPNISFSLIEIPCCLILSSIILRTLAVPWQASSDSESQTSDAPRDRYSSCCSLGSCACEHAIGTAAPRE